MLHPCVFKQSKLAGLEPFKGAATPKFPTPIRFSIFNIHIRHNQVFKHLPSSLQNAL